MIRWNETRYRHTFQSRSGTVGRHFSRVAFRLETTAKLIATQEKLVRSGRYRASLAARLLQEAGGLVIKFGSAVRTRDGKHALGALLEHGSPAHRITARNKKALWWDMPNDRGWLPNPIDKFGNVHPVRSVNHPGTRPYQVLHRAILIVTKGGIAR